MVNEDYKIGKHISLKIKNVDKINELRGDDSFSAFVEFAVEGLIRDLEELEMKMNEDSSKGMSPMILIQRGE